MTLLMTCIAAVITTVIWYLSKRARTMHIGTLALMYWGASLMWLVDAVVEYMEIRAAYFEPDAEAMRNDAFLGLSVIVLGLVIWTVIVLVRDPEHTVRRAVFRRAEK